MRRILAGLVVGWMLIVPGCNRGSRQIGSAAPVFSVSDGTASADLGQLRGRVVVLNFWASWCAPCLEELPSLVELQRRMPEVVVLTISTDEDLSAYKRFISQHTVPSRTINDPEQKVNSLYGTFRYPETYVIDRQGVIRRKLIGPQAWTSPEMMDFLRRLERS